MVSGCAYPMSVLYYAILCPVAAPVQSQGSGRAQRKEERLEEKPFDRLQQPAGRQPRTGLWNQDTVILTA